MPISVDRKAVQIVHVVIETSKALAEVRDALACGLPGNLSLFLRGENGSTARYEIDDPLTALRLTRYQLAAGLYSPQRVIVYEEDGATKIEYDSPSSLLGQFEDDRVDDLARQLDAGLLGTLIGAAK